MESKESLGSSVDMNIAATPNAVLSQQGVDDRVLVEAFVDGVEFTALVLDVGFEGGSHPVTLMPTEVVIALHTIMNACRRT